MGRQVTGDGLVRNDGVGQAAAQHRLNGPGLGTAARRRDHFRDLTKLLGGDGQGAPAQPQAATRQFGGSLFEQGALTVLDAVVMALAAEQDNAYDLMHSRHTNLQ
ncbi:hypothetical protein GCM10029978_042560 [Actinoallomurus acanthiterrae]